MSRTAIFTSLEPGRQETLFVDDEERIAVSDGFYRELGITVFPLFVRDGRVVQDRDGDIIFVRPVEWPEEGALVVAIVCGEAMLCRFMPGALLVYLAGTGCRDGWYVNYRDIGRSVLFGEIVGVQWRASEAA